MEEHNYIDLTAKDLVEQIIARNEGLLSSNEAVVVATGARTGRSPSDRFIVKDEITENTVDWGKVNQPFDAHKFKALWERLEEFIASRERFISHLGLCTDPDHFVPVTVITETAWHNLFAHNLFIRNELATHQSVPNWTIMCMPGFKADPKRDGTNSDGAVIINVHTRQILICGIAYAGEIKKSMFSVLNYLLPEVDVLPMHCSANIGNDGNVALFFGLSGTGKTTLSADPDRLLIGDDEHGWSDKHVFNFEGGCYAKCINLDATREPIIFNAIRYGAIMENVVVDPKTKEPDFANDSLTKNTRVAYPIEHILKRSHDIVSPRPKHIVFLCCDLYGVLPPVAHLTKDQAAYYFLSGYTALVGSTEMNQTAEIKPTFSTCFGAPFFPRPAKVYADLLLKRLNETNARVYLVNTGWTGGPYGQGGERFDIHVSRKIIKAIVSGELDMAEVETLPYFNLNIPKKINGLDEKLLNPKSSWSDQMRYDAIALKLIEQFNLNFKKFDVDDAIKLSGPSLPV